MVPMHAKKRKGASPEPRSRRRESAHLFAFEAKDSRRLTSAATVHGKPRPPNCDTTGSQDCFSPASCFLIAHHAAAYQDRADAVLADAAYFGAGIEPAHSLVELSGRLAF